MKKLPGLVILIFIWLSFHGQLDAQTTGKIAGRVMDASTLEPLPGANVQLVGSNRGIATGMDGAFYLINLPPGTYAIRISMIGYEIKTVENIRVSVNRTTEVNAKLNPSVIEGQEVVVTADRVAVKKDQTSSIRNISSEQMEVLPNESVNVGAQYSLKSASFGRAFLRAGYKGLFMDKSEFGLSFGFGVETFLLYNTRLRIEYAVRDHAILGSTESFSIGFSF